MLFPFFVDAEGCARCFGERIPYIDAHHANTAFVVRYTFFGLMGCTYVLQLFGMRKVYETCASF